MGVQKKGQGLDQISEGSKENSTPTNKNKFAPISIAKSSDFMSKIGGESCQKPLFQGPKTESSNLFEKPKPKEENDKE